MGSSEEFNEYTIYKAIKKYPGKPMRGTIANAITITWPDNARWGHT